MHFNDITAEIDAKKKLNLNLAQTNMIEKQSIEVAFKKTLTFKHDEHFG